MATNSKTIPKAEGAEEQPVERVEKHPQLRALYQSLEAEKEAITKKVAPLRKQRDTVQAKMAPLEEQVNDLTEQIRAIEHPRLPEIDNQLGALAKTMGGRSMSEVEPS